MDKTAAHLLTDFRGQIIENYSGRGMIGKATIGVVFDNNTEIFPTIADILSNGHEDEQEIVADALYWLQSDSYGTEAIYY